VGGTNRKRKEAQGGKYPWASAQTTQSSVSFAVSKRSLENGGRLMAGQSEQFAELGWWCGLVTDRFHSYFLVYFDCCACNELAILGDL
jgi:hypothetical protein